MLAKILSRLAQLRRWLRPDAEAQRYMPILALIVAVFVLILVIVTNRYVTCEHYPDTWFADGTHHYRCQKPKWHRSCSQIITSELTDVCLRHLGPGMTLIHHKKYLRDLECQQAKGPLAYAKGSEGCVCGQLEDDEGRCLTFQDLCRSQYGSGVIVDVVTKPELALEVLFSYGEVYLACRCPEGQSFDSELPECR